MCCGRLLSFLAFTVVTLSVGCASREPAVPKPPAPPSPPPPKSAEAAKPAFDFEAATRREVPPLAVRKIAGEILTAEVEATSEPEVTVGKQSIHVKFPIGTTVPVECYVYDEPKDGAATIAAVVQAVKKNLDVRSFAPTDVYVAGKNAVLAAQAFYLADVNGVKAGGQIKLAYFNSPVVPSLCFHDEPGYSATFKRVVTRFFESANRRDRELQNGTPVSWEVSVTKLQGRPVGFSERRTYKQPTTRLTVAVSVTSNLYPRSALECRAEDTLTTQTVDASGQLLEHGQVSAHGGEIDVNVELKRVAPASYAYSGLYNGKKISGKFKTNDKAGLATDATISKSVRDRLLTGKAASFMLEEYSPSIDPTAPVETIYELESKDERRVQVSFGPLRLSTTVDEEGHAENVVGHIGGATLTIERLAHGTR